MQLTPSFHFSVLVDLWRPSKLPIFVIPLWDPRESDQANKWLKDRFHKVRHFYKPFKNDQWAHRKFSSSPGRRNDTFVKGQLNKEKPQMRGNTPSRTVFRSPGGRYYREMSRSPGRTRSGSQDQRGRSKSPRGKGCLRCNSASHMADRCPHYPFYSGSGCEKCGCLHSTSAHKNHLDRAGSARRFSV